MPQLRVKFLTYNFLLFPSLSFCFPAVPFPFTHFSLSTPSLFFVSFHLIQLELSRKTRNFACVHSKGLCFFLTYFPWGPPKPLCARHRPPKNHVLLQCICNRCIYGNRLCSGSYCCYNLLASHCNWTQIFF